MLMTDAAEYPYTSSTGKRYRLEDRDGRAARVYESGTVLDHENGHLIEGPEASRLTPERAVELNKTKAEMAAERARAFVLSEIRAISPDDIDDFDDAWGAIVGRIASEGFLSDATLQSRVKAAELVGKATEALPDGRRLRESGGPASVDDRLLDFLGAIAPAVKSVLADKIANDNSTNQHKTDVLSGNGSGSNIEKQEGQVIDAAFQENKTGAVGGQGGGAR